MTKNLEKRRRVMQRSMRLGHCICDAGKPCPCDIFTQHDVCQCAGERLEVSQGPVRLTRLVENAGCASKIDLASLRRALGGLEFPQDPRVIVGAAAGDDAGVYMLDEHTAIVQTVDVFTPSVDDPYTFGQISAANSVSDIYAMGGKPLTALSIVGFPIRSVPDWALREILRGGVEKMAEAGVSVIGGHSINDPQVKAGFAVTGVVDPARVKLRAGAQPGDRLILTKPIGTGILAFAGQIDRADPAALAAAGRSMAALNRVASERMLEFGANGCTDVTGFGLIGHLGEMAASSGVDVELVWDDIPLLPTVLECVGQGILPGGIERNRESSAAAVVLGPGVDPLALEVCLDAQTSGGLLIAVAAEKAQALLDRLHADGIVEAAVIGRATGKGKGRIHIMTNGVRRIPAPGNDAVGASVSSSKGNHMSDKHNASNVRGDGCCSPKGAADACCSESSGGQCCPPGEGASECCAPGSGTNDCCAPGQGGGECCGSTAPAQDAQVAGTEATKARFKEFMGAASQPGGLDVAAKQAIAIALSVYSRCEPCVRGHIKKARQMGFTQDEIDEAAWLAIAFGGSPVMMFYEGVRDA